MKRGTGSKRWVLVVGFVSVLAVSAASERDRAGARADLPEEGRARPEFDDAQTLRQALLPSNPQSLPPLDELHDLCVRADGELQGELRVRDLCIHEGATLRAAGDLIVLAEGEVKIHGALRGIGPANGGVSGDGASLVIRARGSIGILGEVCGGEGAPAREGRAAGSGGHVVLDAP